MSYVHNLQVISRLASHFVLWIPNFNRHVCMCKICVAGLIWEMLDSPHLALYDTFFGLYFCTLHGFAANCVKFVLHVLQNEHHLVCFACFACFAATSQQFFWLVLTIEL